MEFEREELANNSRRSVHIYLISTSTLNPRSLCVLHVKISSILSYVRACGVGFMAYWCRVFGWTLISDLAMAWLRDERMMDMGIHCMGKEQKKSEGCFVFESRKRKRAGLSTFFTGGYRNELGGMRRRCVLVNRGHSVINVNVGKQIKLNK